MALVGNGSISLNAVNIELGRSGTTQISMNDTIVRTLFGVPSGQISMSQGYSKSSRASPENYTTPGTYSWVVPSYNTLTVKMWGGGGGSGDTTWNIGSLGGAGTYGGDGGTSSFGSYITATGGTKGANAGNFGTPGTGGTGTGGDINESGEAGTQTFFSSPDRQVSIGGHAGGVSYGGGASSYNNAYLGYANGNGNGYPGNSYGGGASAYNWNDGGNGGGLKNIATWDGGSGGGFTMKTWSAGALTPGSTITITVGAGGSAGIIIAFNTPILQSAGAPGAILISWS
jgi:hypothetical protein